jgi:uncharacterized membrane protein YebE (DUF533 family)
MFDPKKLLDGLLGSSQTGSGSPLRGKAEQALQMARDNPLAAGALAAVLLGTDPGRKVAGAAIKLGGVAAIGSLAYRAYQNYQNGRSPAQAPASGEPELLPPPSDTGFHPSQAPQGETEFALTLVRAMIAAAKADGRIDDEERQKIVGRLGEAGMDSQAEAFIKAELEAPLDLDALVAAARSEEQKVELYTASRLTVDPDSRAERGYLDMLAGRLGLPDALIDHIEATVSSVKEPVVAGTSPASHW